MQPKPIFSSRPQITRVQMIYQDTSVSARQRDSDAWLTALHRACIATARTFGTIIPAHQTP